MRTICNTEKEITETEVVNGLTNFCLMSHRIETQTEEGILAHLHFHLRSKRYLEWYQFSPKGHEKIFRVFHKRKTRKEE